MIKKLTIGKLTIELRIEWEKSYMEVVRSFIRQGLISDAVRVYKDNTGVTFEQEKKNVNHIQANLVSWE